MSQRPASGTTHEGAKPARHYDASYSRFTEDIYREIRVDAFGEDIGQNSWLTAAELRTFANGLALSTGHRLLDVACGSGGPLLAVAEWTGCTVVGVELHEHGVGAAATMAHERGLETRARFQRHDASLPLPFPDRSFEGVMCIDAINHLPDRHAVLAEWARVLTPGGRVVFTDPIVVTGALTNAEIAARSAAGFYLFVPPGTDERLLAEVGLEIVSVTDLTPAMAEMGRRRRVAREKRSKELREIEGGATFEAEQAFFGAVELLATERRLSRLAFLARKPG